MWSLQVEGAADRLRQLAREVGDSSTSAQLAAEHAGDPKVSDLRSQLKFIEREISSLNRQAEAEGVGARASAVLAPNLPAALREAIATATKETAPPLVLPEPEFTPVRRYVDGGDQPQPFGTGHEVLLQAFNWESHREDWWNKVAMQAHWFADAGFTVVWLPPPTDSVSDEGYLPRDLYNLNSKYGAEEELRRCVAALQSAGLKVLGDAVLNHRCAHHQDENGVWNQFGGRLAWDESAIVSDDPNFGGRGNKSTGDFFHAAPNVDHTQPFVRRDICEWMNWLRDTIGFDGWRLDFVRGFTGEAVGLYMDATAPDFAVGEYWDTLSYDWQGVPEHNQDKHRQQIINWINAAGGRATAFDVTTKGILHAVFERCEYWRLRGADGKPPGLLGWWPSRAVTFLENHDTGSTQGHWRFPSHGLEQGYAYILSHPGTPTVFYDHLCDPKMEQVLRRILAFRRRQGIHCRSAQTILTAERDLYVAQIDNHSLCKLGPGDYVPLPEEGWVVAEAGNNWTLYERH